MIVDESWSLIKDGAYTGAIQNVGNAPLVGRVVVTLDGAPDEGAGGFTIDGLPDPIQILETESLYVRSAGGQGAVVLA